MTDTPTPCRLVLVRHGEAGNDLPRTLTLAGRGQAGAITDALRGDRVAGVWTSTMPRAEQTAAIIGRGLKTEVTADDRLREWLIDEEQMLSCAVTPEQLDATFHTWLDGDLTPALYGETGAQVRDRLACAGAEIAAAHPGEVCVVVSHGGIIQTGLRHLCGLDAEFVRAHPLPVAGSVVVDVDAAGWVCRRWHDVQR